MNTSELLSREFIYRKYFYAGGTRIAMRLYQGGTTTEYWLLSDHLGSQSITANADGSLNSEVRYSAFGETRYTTATETPTDYLYTGQRMDRYINMYWYTSRWYDPVLAHFNQPDTIVPDPNNAQDWDRYAYVNNNPVNYSDPSGHMLESGCSIEGCSGNPYATIHIRYMGGFPAIAGPKVTNLGKQAEDSYIPPGMEPGNPLSEMLGDRYRSNLRTSDPSAVWQLAGDVLNQGLIYKSYNDPKAIQAYLLFEENANGSMNISSIDIWNNTNNDVNLESVNISTEPMTPCFSSFCIGEGPQTYGIAQGVTLHDPKFSGLMLIPTYKFQEVSLIPSGVKNESNLVNANTMVNVLSSFYQYDVSTGNQNLYGSLNYSFRWW